MKADNVRFSDEVWQYENKEDHSGSDWYNTANQYLITNAADQFKRVPAGAALNASYEAVNGNVPYTLLSLQMLGYVSTSKRGQLNEKMADPSDYRRECAQRKNGVFSIEPDKSTSILIIFLKTSENQTSKQASRHTPLTTSLYSAVFFVLYGIKGIEILPKRQRLL